MNQSNEIEQPYRGQRFTSFEHLKKYLEEYGQKNYVKFWIRSSHTRNSQKSKISKTMNPDLKYVSVKFACIFGGEKIRCRGSGIRKSYTYRNLGCPCMINAVVGEDGNHVKLDTVILEHNHALCKTLYDSLKKTKKKNQALKNNNEISKKKFDKLNKDDYISQSENIVTCNDEDSVNADAGLKSDENCLKSAKDKCSKIVKIFVANSENQTNKSQDEANFDDLVLTNYSADNTTRNTPEICRLCLSSKEKLSPIFNPNLPLKSTILSFKIMGCASIEINCNDGLPNNICTTCEANLDIAYNFRITCEKSDSILRETYENDKNIINAEDETNTNDGNSLQQNFIFQEDCTKNLPQTTEETQEALYFQFAITCPICKINYETYENMLDHLGSHQNEVSLLACNICTLVCTSVQDLQEHMKGHLKDNTENEVWACEIRSASFSTSEDFKIQKTSHEEAETKTKKPISGVRYLCNVCGKIFKTKDRFQAHKNMHEGLRPHVCMECGRGFADRKNLHQHYDVVHLRKVRYECPVCQKKFYTRTKMKSHMTMHSGDKPFTCDICNKSFRLKMNMNKHKKTHYNERPYQCDKCSAAFLEKNLLKRHSYKHGGVRPFGCPVCGHGFSTKFCLKKHLKDSKCRGVVIADPENYQWIEVIEGRNCQNSVVVFKTDEDEIQEAEPIDLNIYQDESNT